MKRLNQFLNNRNGNWHYVRRVPNLYRELDPRTMIRASLRTSSLEVARYRRDAMVEADNAYWASLIHHQKELVSANGEFIQDIAINEYRSAKSRALARGYIYTPTSQLVESTGLNEILARLKDALKQPVQQKQEVEALLGGPKTAVLKISIAFDLYCKELALGELHGKSPAQKKSWRKVKLRAVNNFIKLSGDLAMDKITRKHARNFYSWWGKRISPTDGSRPLNPNSANRDIGNLRKLFRVYWEYEGEESRENPFRKLRYVDNVYKDIPGFSDDWVRSRILKPKAFEGLNKEAALIVFSLIETGCRPSEIANLLPDNIKLDHEVPHIEIKARVNRQLKSNSAGRVIPLVGVSLLAFQEAKNGFPHYRDRSSLLSASLMKTFRLRKLFPTKDHRIYSFRHAFEKRMLEAGLDYGLRCLLMGHSNTRPAYGDGGSLSYRRDELLKIAHPVPDDFKEILSAF
ncbi:MAG: integrase [Robiginitomaculum sp.]|nr:MAG: integrase [Robiginitomaculum sp.]